MSFNQLRQQRNNYAIKCLLYGTIGVASVPAMFAGLSSSLVMGIIVGITGDGKVSRNYPLVWGIGSLFSVAVIGGIGFFCTKRSYRNGRLCYDANKNMNNLISKTIENNS